MRTLLGMLWVGLVVPTMVAGLVLYVVGEGAWAGFWLPTACLVGLVATFTYYVDW